MSRRIAWLIATVIGSVAPLVLTYQGHLFAAFIAATVALLFHVFASRAVLRANRRENVRSLTELLAPYTYGDEYPGRYADGDEPREFPRDETGGGRHK
jgi:hypothetical protein